MSNIVKIEFYNKKIIYCKNDTFNLKKNLTVIVKTPRGLEFGFINELNPKKYDDQSLVENTIVRISTKQDYQRHIANKKEEQKAILKCKELSIKHNLNIQLLDANFTFDRSQLMFRFISDSRIDFRDLAKDLASAYKTRIELRQIGIRDKAKEVGGIGQCGRELCCGKFLKDLNSVSINMAKNQNISLNPNKINGCCGRLLCCLNYEDENYRECKQQLPNIGDKIKYNGEEATVISIDILNRKYKIETKKNGIVEECVSNGSIK